MCKVLQIKRLLFCVIADGIHGYCCIKVSWFKSLPWGHPKKNTVVSLYKAIPIIAGVSLKERDFPLIRPFQL